MRRRGAGPRPTEIVAEALARLADYSWPGNIRELENVVERAAILSDGHTIAVRDLPPLLNAQPIHPPTTIAIANDTRPLKERVAAAVQEIERAAIRDALKAEDGSPTRAARRLGISRASFYTKLKELEIRL